LYRNVIYWKPTQLHCTFCQADFLLRYSSTLKMELTFSSETTVDSQRSTWRYIPADLSHRVLVMPRIWRGAYTTGPAWYFWMFLHFCLSKRSTMGL
jgi:hypothetical protein